MQNSTTHYSSHCIYELISKTPSIEDRFEGANVLTLHTYRCARGDYKEDILLDANENALAHPFAPLEELSPDLKQTLDLDHYLSPSLNRTKFFLTSLCGLPTPAHVFLSIGCVEAPHARLHGPLMQADPRHPVNVQDVGVLKVSLEFSNGEGEAGVKG
ncbi:hypothetical protein BDQ12DRAFT_735990 [Crucibulum laeve]|uniref:Uncharacterized protein n=1 Tax=Crucibulum laeve TaxID=68775 RepID=A0A5C3LX00_9AGAR|nr:hypothetical protein BDQ12DRAFT_735990 [Crucibulum laeve]